MMINIVILCDCVRCRPKSVTGSVKKAKTSVYFSLEPPVHLKHEEVFCVTFMYQIYGNGSPK